MKGLFYNLLVIITKKMGTWVFVLISRGIAFGYFLFFPKRVAVGSKFYKALFPDKKYPYHLWCTFLQYQNFTSVFLDRILLRDTGNLDFTSLGWENLNAVLEKKCGGIILMSHLGNWEVAAHLLKKQKNELRLLLYMGIRHKEDIERMQKESLSENGIKIIAVEEDGGSPYDLIEGMRFLESGGLVSLAGDIIWRKDQPSVQVDFLGHELYLPEVPYLLALLSGAPLFIYFSFRAVDNIYHFSISKPIYIEKTSRGKRKKAIKNAAQKYADLLEEALRKHPFEWYHFEPFLGPKIERDMESD